MFRTFGNITHCKVVRDKKSGQSLGYGFVKFETAEAANRAVSALNGFAIENKKLKVAVSKPPSSREDQKRNLYISGLPLAYTNVELAQLLSPFGTIVESRVLHGMFSCAVLCCAVLSLLSRCALCIAELHASVCVCMCVCVQRPVPAPLVV